jgi:SAM-dependent methyltransferase
VGGAYTQAADPVSLREELGQVATARRALEEVERLVAPGLACDLGCWTGSFLVAARERGWATVGVEPSAWASARARERGLDVRTTDLEGHGLAPGSARLVVLADVLEHLVAPAGAVEVAATLLEPGGILYATVPDAGSAVARLLGRHWWSVMPMHLQYFTRSSLRRLLEDGGFDVRVVHRHPKVFSARYYAERLSGRAPALSGAAVRLLERAGWADRLVAPDLRDRLAVVAVRPR